MEIYPWPPELRAVGIEFDLLGQSFAGPLTLTQAHQIGSLDGGYWVATLGDIGIVGRAAMLSFRRLRGVLRGGANAVLVPVCDKSNAPWPGESTSLELADFSDDATFSDGSMFSQNQITVVMGTSASARSTRIEVEVQSAGSIVGGEFFSIGNHLYQIDQVLDETPPSGTDAVWQISPPLREDVDVGAVLDFDNPRCLMVPLTETQMNLMTFRNKAGVLSPVFFETMGDLG